MTRINDKGCSYPAELPPTWEKVTDPKVISQFNRMAANRAYLKQLEKAQLRKAMDRPRRRRSRSDFSWVK